MGTLTAGAGVALKTPPLPTAFEMWNARFTLEVDPVIGAGGRTVEIGIALEIVAYLGESPIGSEDCPYKELAGVTPPQCSSRKPSMLAGETIRLAARTP